MPHSAYPRSRGLACAQAGRLALGTLLALTMLTGCRSRGLSPARMVPTHDILLLDAPLAQRTERAWRDAHQAIADGLGALDKAACALPQNKRPWWRCSTLSGRCRRYAAARWMRDQHDAVLSQAPARWWAPVLDAAAREYRHSFTAIRVDVAPRAQIQQLAETCRNQGSPLLAFRADALPVETPEARPLLPTLDRIDDRVAWRRPRPASVTRRQRLVWALPQDCNGLAQLYVRGLRDAYRYRGHHDATDCPPPERTSALLAELLTHSRLDEIAEVPGALESTADIKAILDLPPE